MSPAPSTRRSFHSLNSFTLSLPGRTPTSAATSQSSSTSRASSVAPTQHNKMTNLKRPASSLPPKVTKKHPAAMKRPASSVPPKEKKKPPASVKRPATNLDYEVLQGAVVKRLSTTLPTWLMNSMPLEAARQFFPYSFIASGPKLLDCEMSDDEAEINADGLTWRAYRSKPQPRDIYWLNWWSLGITRRHWFIMTDGVYVAS